MRILLVGIIGLLLVSGCPSSPGNNKIGSSEAVESWLLTELAGQRIGHTVTRAERFEQGWRFETTMQMDIKMMEIEQTVSAHSVSTTGMDFSLQSLTFAFRGQDRTMEAVAAVQENNLIVKLAGEPPRSQPLPGPIYPAEALGRLALDYGMKAGGTFDAHVFEVGTMSIDRYRVSVGEWETVQASETSFNALALTLTGSFFTIRSWVDSSGMTVVEESPPGIRSVRTTPAGAVAGAGEDAGLDMLKMFRVTVDTLISNPERVSFFLFEISGIGTDELPPDIGEVRQSDGRLLVEVNRVEPPPLLTGLPVPGQDEYLSPTMTIQCDDPELIDRANEIVAGEQDAVIVAQRLVTWVYDYVEKIPIASFPTALDVLRNPQGDCNEHAALFAGIARAAGLPCRVVVGLVYMDRAFYYHAWNEVWLGYWVPVDPTLNQFPASALHLKLGGGDLQGQAGVLPLVGRISIRVQEFD